jgi:hypothetical protein
MQAFASEPFTGLDDFKAVGSRDYFDFGQK